MAEAFDAIIPGQCSGVTITSGYSQLSTDPWQDNYPTEPGGASSRKMGYAPAYDTAYPSSNPEWHLCGLKVKIGQYGDSTAAKPNNNGLRDIVGLGAMEAVWC
jgi:hypothetical protein